ncbi:twin-arginine translocation signal domain-containing protein [Burkholderia sp. Ac-20345]|uniref:twin-arginine translocation signal domain-containing protein n=1 Tax=Burkholderia sp. Ac-20345 TaxID=2703891 RepID=UPI003216CADF
MKKKQLKRATHDQQNPEGTQPSRRDFLKSASLAAAALGIGGQASLAAEKPQASVSARRTSAQTLKVPPASLPKGMNILFVISDQERYFDTTRFPAPGRERIRQQGTTFTNHQIASCVCSPSRSTIYTGQHIQETGVFDNSESVW